MAGNLVAYLATLPFKLAIYIIRKQSDNFIFRYKTQSMILFKYSNLKDCRTKRNQTLYEGK